MTDAVPEARRRGRPPRISRERIVEAAFELGIENLTMVAVATRLGVSHQSLYGWVRDRDELVDLVSDQLIAGIDLNRGPRSDGWRGTLRHLADGLRDIATRNPGFAPAALVRYRTGPGYVRLNEQAVHSLTSAGAEPLMAQHLYETVTTVTLGWLVREESTAALRFDPTPVAVALDDAATGGTLGQTTATAATAALSVAPEERYRLMIEALLLGLPEFDPGSAKPDDLLDIREVVPTLAR